MKSVLFTLVCIVLCVSGTQSFPLSQVPSFDDCGGGQIRIKRLNACLARSQNDSSPQVLIREHHHNTNSRIYVHEFVEVREVRADNTTEPGRGIALGTLAPIEVTRTLDHVVENPDDDNPEAPTTDIDTWTAPLPDALVGGDTVSGLVLRWRVIRDAKFQERRYGEDESIYLYRNLLKSDVYFNGTATWPFVNETNKLELVWRVYTLEPDETTLVPVRLDIEDVPIQNRSEYLTLQTNTTRGNKNSHTFAFPQSALYVNDQDQSRVSRRAGVDIEPDIIPGKKYFLLNAHGATVRVRVPQLARYEYDGETRVASFRRYDPVVGNTNMFLTSRNRFTFWLLFGIIVLNALITMGILAWSVYKGYNKNLKEFGKKRKVFEETLSKALNGGGPRAFDPDRIVTSRDPPISFPDH